MVSKVCEKYLSLQLMSTFDYIFQEHYHSLLLYSLKFIKNENDAHDIVQEVFVAVWEKEKYDLESGHLKSYLFNAVRNGCLNYLKHQTIVRNHVDEEQEILRMHELDFYKSGEKSLIEREDLEKIYAAIDSLSDSYREIIQLSRFEGKKNKEIAEKLGIPIRTIETRLFRALNKLRTVLSSKQIFILMHLPLKK